MKEYELYWSPTGRKIAKVTANTERGAIRKTPPSYRTYKSEVFAVEVPQGQKEPERS